MALSVGKIDYRPTGSSEYYKYKDAMKYAPGGAAAQEMLGQGIDKAFAERRQMALDADRRRMQKLKEGILNYNAGQAMAKDMDDLNIMGDTASQDFNQILTNGSRQIADYAAFLNKELKRTGDYNAYSEKMSKLKAEVTNMKGLKTNVNAFLDAYAQGKNDGTLSDYNSVEILAMAEDMANGSPNGGWQNINGEQVWKGKTVLGDDYQVSASEFRNLTNRLQKKENIDSILDPALQVNRTAQGNILSFNQQPIGTDGKRGQSPAQMAEAALQRMLGNVPGNKDRKMASLLVDHFGYTREQADAFFDPRNPKFEPGAGEELLKQKWLQRAEGMYGVNQQAVQNYWHKAEDQKYEHREEKAQELQLKRQVDETNRAFGDTNTPAIWNTPMDFPVKKATVGQFEGLIDRFSVDLSRLGLTAQSIEFEDDTVVPNYKDKKLESIITEHGQPKGMFVKNPLNPAGSSIFIPFNANPMEIQELIRQANGMPLMGYTASSMDNAGYLSGPKTDNILGSQRAAKTRNNQYNSQ